MTDLELWEVAALSCLRLDGGEDPFVKDFRLLKSYRFFLDTKDIWWNTHYRLILLNKLNYFIKHNSSIVFKIKMGQYREELLA